MALNERLPLFAVFLCSLTLWPDRTVGDGLRRNEALPTFRITQEEAGGNKIQALDGETGGEPSELEEEQCLEQFEPDFRDSKFARSICRPEPSRLRDGGAGGGGGGGSSGGGGWG